MKSQMLYVRCSLCDATRKTRTPISFGTDQLPAGSPCPLCADTVVSDADRGDGYNVTGMTVGQLDRMRNDRTILLGLLYELGKRSEQGGVGPLAVADIGNVLECFRTLFPNTGELAVESDAAAHLIAGRLRKLAGG